MSIEINSLFGLLILIADVWAIVSTAGSNASTGKKVLWIIAVILLPLLGFLVWLFIGPRSTR